ncbi:pectate lyase [Paenibacillus mucilaginosus]|uniref:pectate lyase family protein n=1 Tax=Paenibacillus mucilaginosus TaxID=61624 RepID=UPI00240D9447|nr:pectate lyase [Paenibacillus mucilaginosus]WFA19453.1 pectate lyase [Paenibacillus mucilaginosus]
MTTASKMKRMWSTFTAITMLSSVLFMVPAAQAATLYADSQLGANDGWGSRTGTGTTSFTLNGGKSTTSTETPVTVVTTRDQLKTAVAGTTKAVILVRGTIDLNAGNTESTYASGTGYNLTTYQNAYYNNDSATISSQETARAAAATKQKNQVVISVGSNKTIIGESNTSIIKGGSLYLKGSNNVIIRNIQFHDALDFFPQWDPSDSGGNWNAAYDSMTLDGATNIWIDHCTFADKVTDTNSGMIMKNSSTGEVKPFVRHDGLLDAKNGSNFITISYNVFQDHYKTSLIGSSDSTTTDDGKLKLTYHHNYFLNSKQRSPRVRYGMVHVYNNYYVGTADQVYGIGYSAKVYSQNNYLNVSAATTKLAGYSGSESVKGKLYDTGTIYKAYGSSTEQSINIATANSPQVGTDVGWTPTSYYSYTADATANVPSIVSTYAGAGKPVR